MYRLPGRGWQFALLLALVVGLLHPIARYWSVFSGDAEIHLVYARNLLRGHPLQFNLNQPNSGETSMGFMLLVSLIMRLFGAALTPLLMKLICLVSFYLTAVTTFLIAGRIGVRSPWREIAAIAVLWLPGQAYSAMYCTENIVFAALSGFFLLAVMNSGWFSGPSAPSVGRDIHLSFFAGVLFWVRPEAAPLMAILLCVRGTAGFVQPRNRRREAAQMALVGVILALSIAAYVSTFHHFAGEMPYGAGKARRLISEYDESRWILGVPVNVKVLLRLASYFPITLTALLAGVFALRRELFDVQKRLMIFALLAVFFGFMGTYVFGFLPAVHFARYSVFVWPLGCALAVLGLQMVSDRGYFRPGVRAAVFCFLFIAFLGVVGYETWLRREMVESGVSPLRQAEQVPEDRATNSAAMSESLGLTVGAPAVLGYEEVQSRYELTDNFSIVSLDGVTDSRFLRYFCGRWVDHDGYLIDMRVNYLSDFPDLNADKTRWSLADLLRLEVGQSLVRPGITYTMIAPELVRVLRTVRSATDRPGGICGQGR